MKGRLMSVTQSDNCFVLMPFGRKANPFPGPSQIDFDRVYEKLVEPAVLKANLKPLRADQEISSGLIHLAMFERLLLCDFAIADLTTANPNVYYELGIRHAVRPWSTVLICGSTSRLPFDIEMSRTYLYAINDRGELSNPQNDIREIQARLEDVRQRIVSNSVTEDSPLFTLLSHEGYGGPDLTKLHATLRNRIDRCNEFEKLRNDIALSDVAHLREIQNRHPPGIIENAPIAVELLTAFRRAADWDDIIALVK
ncbi:MAG TPA: hypothetical protein VLX58_09560, partial [Bryobacteraceae bacterium]|nr:hypothetical protein [Bryobacteraceae bacterium]